MRCVLLAMAMLVLIPFAMGANSQVRPTIWIYTGADTGFAQALASLIEASEAIDSDVKIVNSAETLALAASLPQTQCVIAYAANKAEITGMDPALITFFEAGGGLIGLREMCYRPSAGDLAIKVFPTHANGSVQQYVAGQKRARNYTKADAGEITAGLPDRFELIGMGIYFSVGPDGKYLPVPGDYQVPFRDGETGAPIVLAYESERGGRSVAFPAVWVVSASRVDIYYGNLVNDENFARLFTNCVLWAAQGSSRFAEVSKDLDVKLEEARTRQARLIKQAEEARKKENLQRTLLLVAVWAIGLLVCGLVVKKVILAPIEVESREGV